MAGVWHEDGTTFLACFDIFPTSGRAETRQIAHVDRDLRFAGVGAAEEGEFLVGRQLPSSSTLRLDRAG